MVEYQGFKIQSAPHHQTVRDKWRLLIVISFEDQRGVRSREFSPEVLYATEHDADIHGATLGQRIIDGKVEGQYVEDMKTDDRRAMPRFLVQFRTTFLTATKSERMGYLLDLSLGGCRIESPVTVEPVSLLELRYTELYPDCRAFTYGNRRRVRLCIAVDDDTDTPVGPPITC